MADHPAARGTLETLGTLVIIGSGGHAKVVLATARRAGWTSIELADDDPARAGHRVLGVAVTRSAQAALADAGARCVIAIGDNATRARLAASAACGFVTLVDPAAYVHESARLGAGTVVVAGAIVQPDAVIGAHAILNTGSSVDHDCTLGVAVHLGPGARLCGGVRVGAQVLIGVGAAVIPGITIGDRAVIGAGAAVVGDIEPGVTAVGVPARVSGRRTDP